MNNAHKIKENILYYSPPHQQRWWQQAWQGCQRWPPGHHSPQPSPQYDRNNNIVNEKSYAITSRILRLIWLLVSSISFSILAVSLQAPALNSRCDKHCHHEMHVGERSLSCGMNWTFWSLHSRLGSIDQDRTKSPHVAHLKCNSLHDYQASPVGAKVGKDKCSLWSSCKLVVEVIAVSHVVNHLLVCKPRSWWSTRNQRV